MRFFRRSKIEVPERVKEHWHVTGRGLEPSSAWTDHRRWEGKEQRADHAWFAGFLSGISLERNEHLLREHSFEEVLGWLDARCEAFPNDQICYSAAKVAAKLMWPDTDLQSP